MPVVKKNAYKVLLMKMHLHILKIMSSMHRSAPDRVFKVQSKLFQEGKICVKDSLQHLSHVF